MPGQSTAIITSARTSRRIISLILGAAIFFYYLAFNLGIAFESQKNKSTAARGVDSQRLSSLVIVFGKYELDRPTFYALVCTAMVLMVAIGAQIGIWCRQWKEKRLEKHKDVSGSLPSKDKSSLDVIIVGCGPKSVGWFHLMQFLDMAHINVRAVVEPFYLDKTKCPYPPQSFVDLVMMLDEMGVRCLYHINQLDVLQKETLCIIAGRTPDNPRLFRECIGVGASHIYLESPGAPTVEQLKDMQALAAARGVDVYMGYQRLCSPYIEQAIELSNSIPKSHVFFCHNENYTSSELQLVVSRYPEGMIRSMAVQELAVLVTQCGVKVDNIMGFKVNTNRLFSEKLTYFNENSGNGQTDLSRAAFKITTKKGRSVSVMGDRCGGLVSFAVVKSRTGKELQRFQSHDQGQVSVVQDELRGEHGEIADQFIIGREEYLEMKKRLVNRILSGDARSKPSWMVSIQDGIDIMALADYCNIEINAVVKVED